LADPQCSFPARLVVEHFHGALAVTESQKLQTVFIGLGDIKIDRAGSLFKRFTFSGSGCVLHYVNEGDCGLLRFGRLAPAYEQPIYLSSS